MIVFATVVACIALLGVIVLFFLQDDCGYGAEYCRASESIERLRVKLEAATSAADRTKANFEAAVRAEVAARLEFHQRQAQLRERSRIMSAVSGLPSGKFRPGGRDLIDRGAVELAIVDDVLTVPRDEHPGAPPQSAMPGDFAPPATPRMPWTSITVTPAECEDQIRAIAREEAAAAMREWGPKFDFRLLVREEISSQCVASALRRPRPRSA